MSASIGSANVSMGMFANTGSSCPRVAGGHQETDIALKIGVGRVDRRQRIGHQRRQVRRAVGPGADYAVVVGAEQDARWSGPVGRPLFQEGFEDCMRFLEDGSEISRWIAVVQPGRRSEMGKWKGGG